LPCDSGLGKHFRERAKFFSKKGQTLHTDLKEKGQKQHKKKVQMVSKKPDLRNMAPKRAKYQP
jgi:hypothetical protein